MKESRFNHLTIAPDSAALLYNVLSNALVELGPDELAIYQDPSRWDCAPEFIQELEVMGFIVPDTFDELAFVEFQNRKNCMQSDVLSITIAPTLDCMCCCPYCFEVKGSHSMGADIQEAAIKAIETLIEENGYRRLDISWYGGEPLLALSAIESMTQALIRICDNHGVEYNAYIITNGVMLTPDNAARLNECHVKAAQVTIDGLKETHDELRPLKNGSGTFERILSNISASAPLAKFEINIRTNVGLDNSSEYIALRDMISDMGFGNVHSYPARKEYYPHSQEDVEETCMDPQVFSSFLKRNNLFKGRQQRKAECFSCLGESLHSFAIDSYGNVYKCWNEVGDTACSFALITPEQPRITTHSVNKALPYLITHCLDDSECRDCKVLPLCMGGCIYQKINTGEKECIEEKYCLDEYVLEILRKRRKEES